MTQPASGPRSAQINVLTLITPIKQGFIPEFPTMRYADRVRRVLGIIDEQLTRDGTTMLDLIRSVHFAQWSLIDHDERLLFTSFYVGQLEHYLRDFSTRSAAALDLIWQHCDGYPGAVNFDAFCAWVEAHRVRPACAYAANPDVTVLDVDWLRGFYRLYQGLLRDAQDRPAELPARLAQLERDAARIDAPREELQKRLVRVLVGLRACMAIFDRQEMHEVVVHLWRAYLGPDAEPPPSVWAALRGEAAVPVAAE